ncbi:formate/nitrite transporter family protein [Pedobacter sp. UYEF25]
MANEESKQPKEITQILDEQIETSLHEHRRSRFSLLLSSFTAGLEVGFSLLLMAAAYSMFVGNSSENFMHVLIAFCYPLGFIFVIIGRSELFTEHTTLAIFPVLNGDETIKNLIILWGIVYIGNIIGGCIFSVLAVYMGNEMMSIKPDTFYQLAHNLTDFSGQAILVSGVFAGWLMGLLAWLIASVNETISRILMVVLVTTVIGFLGLHHSIVGNIELFAGYISSDKITFGMYVKTLLLASAGNLLGGVFFVALLKFSHVKNSEKLKH